MKEIIIDLDLLDQLRLAKAAASTGKSNDELVASAFEALLCSEDSNNLSPRKEEVAA